MGQAQFLLLLFAFDMALSIPMDTFGGVLIGLQRFDLMNYSLITVMVSQAVAWVIVLPFTAASSPSVSYGSRQPGGQASRRLP